MPAPLAQASLNGQMLPVAEARVSALDRGFLFADGAYEAIPVYAGHAFRLTEHLARLARSLRELRIADPHTATGWRALVDALVAANGGGQMSVYLQVTRGAELGREHLFPKDAAPTVFGCCFAWSGPPEALLRAGLDAVTHADERWGRCDIKSINLLANVLARQNAFDAQASEAILVRDGLALEGSSSSLLVVESDSIVTPPDGPHILPGTTRDFLGELAAELQIAWRREDIPLERLRAAQEIWLASSTREVLAVTRLDGVAVGAGLPGPLWQRMHRAYRAHTLRLIENAAGGNAPLQFPCALPLKIIGNAGPELRARVIALIAPHGRIDQTSLRERASGGGRYLALTVTVELADRAALEALYAALRASPDVRWAL